MQLIFEANKWKQLIKKYTELVYVNDILVYGNISIFMYIDENLVGRTKKISFLSEI